MKTDTSIGIRALCAILEVALYRTTDSCQLAPYLMMPSGLQINLQKSIVLALSKRFIR